MCIRDRSSTPHVTTIYTDTYKYSYQYLTENLNIGDRYAFVLRFPRMAKGNPSYDAMPYFITLYDFLTEPWCKAIWDITDAPENYLDLEEYAQDVYKRQELGHAIWLIRNMSSCLFYRKFRKFRKKSSLTGRWTASGPGSDTFPFSGALFSPTHSFQSSTPKTTTLSTLRAFSKDKMPRDKRLRVP